jgi:hypothetical protein
MPTEITEKIDVRLLVEWLGVQGARAGLEHSRVCTNDNLVHIARELGISASKGTRRKELVTEIVRVAGRRIDKPIEELMRMERDELVAYFEGMRVDTEELVELIKQLNLNPRDHGRRSLIEFAAQELSETGRFLRVSSQGLPHSV